MIDAGGAYLLPRLIGLAKAKELVYGMQPLAAGQMAVIAHRPAGTVLLRLTGEATEAVANFGPGAVNSYNFV